ncbi:MAG: hypothetical protein IT359_05405 [Gemmatimonadaceae bacterium]|nr:hypothetical protein [Gemmatimonadaceae bacterium]
MLDRHAVQALLASGVTPGAVAQQYAISRLTVERIAKEPAVTAADDAAARAARRLGRPRVDAALRTTVRDWLTTEPGLAPGEIWRRLREAGTPLGLSTTNWVIAGARTEIPAEVMVRFEGVAGEARPVRLRPGRRPPDE